MTEPFRLQIHWVLYLLLIVTLALGAAKYLGSRLRGYEPDTIATWWWDEPGAGQGPMRAIFIFMYAAVIALSLLPVVRLVGGRWAGTQAAILWSYGLGVGVLPLGVAVASLVQRAHEVVAPADQGGDGPHYIAGSTARQNAQIAAMVVAAACGAAMLIAGAFSMACAWRFAAATEVTLRGRGSGSGSGGGGGGAAPLLGALRAAPVMLFVSAYGAAQLAVTASEDWEQQQLFFFTALAAFLLELAQALLWDAGGGALVADVAPRDLPHAVAAAAAARRPCELRVAATEAALGNIKFHGRFAVIVAHVYVALSIASGLAGGGVAACVYAVLALLAACSAAVAFVQAWAGAVYRRGDFKQQHQLFIAASAPPQYLMHGTYKLEYSDFASAAGPTPPAPAVAPAAAAAAAPAGGGDGGDVLTELVLIREPSQIAPVPLTKARSGLDAFDSPTAETTPAEFLWIEDSEYDAKHKAPRKRTLLKRLSLGDSETEDRLPHVVLPLDSV